VGLDVWPKAGVAETAVGVAGFTAGEEANPNVVGAGVLGDFLAKGESALIPPNAPNAVEGLGLKAPSPLEFAVVLKAEDDETGVTEDANIPPPTGLADEVEEASISLDPSNDKPPKAGAAAIVSVSSAISVSGL